MELAYAVVYLIVQQKKIK